MRTLAAVRSWVYVCKQVILYFEFFKFYNNTYAFKSIHKPKNVIMNNLQIESATSILMHALKKKKNTTW